MNQQDRMNTSISWETTSGKPARKRSRNIHVANSDDVDSTMETVSKENLELKERISKLEKDTENRFSEMNNAFQGRLLKLETVQKKSESTNSRIECITRYYKRSLDMHSHFLRMSIDIIQSQAKIIKDTKKVPYSMMNKMNRNMERFTKELVNKSSNSREIEEIAENVMAKYCREPLENRNSRAASVAENEDNEDDENEESGYEEQENNVVNAAITVGISPELATLYSESFKFFSAPSPRHQSHFSDENDQEEEEEDESTPPVHSSDSPESENSSFRNYSVTSPCYVYSPCSPTYSPIRSPPSYSSSRSRSPRSDSESSTRSVEPTSPTHNDDN